MEEEEKKKRKKGSWGTHWDSISTHSILLERSRRDNSNYTLEEH